MKLAWFALALLSTVGCASRSPAPAVPSVAPLPAEAYGARRPSSPGLAYIFLPGDAERTAVRYQNVDGQAIFEGDIMLGPAHEVQLRFGFARPIANRKQAAASPRASHLWPGGVLPYVIDASVSPKKRRYVDWAVSHVNTTSVLKLRPRTPADADYVVFTQPGGSAGCSAFVGRAGGPQEIIVSQCSRGSVVHEIGHSAGLYHEHSRSDRDAYVHVDLGAVEPGRQGNFARRPESKNLGPYDYASIMHYDRWAFSAAGRPTITPTHPEAQIGQREGFSRLDRQGLAALYASAPPIGTPPIGTPVGIPPIASTWPPAAFPFPGLGALPTELPPLPSGFPSLPPLPSLSGLPLGELPALGFPFVVR